MLFVPAAAPLHSRARDDWLHSEDCATICDSTLCGCASPRMAFITMQSTVVRNFQHGVGAVMHANKDNPCCPGPPPAVAHLLLATICVHVHVNCGAECNLDASAGRLPHCALICCVSTVLHCFHPATDCSVANLVAASACVQYASWLVQIIVFVYFLRADALFCPVRMAPSLWLVASDDARWLQHSE